MLVDVLQLRERGEKRPREALQAAAPVRGKLRLTSGRPGWHAGLRNAPLLAGIIELGTVEWAIPPLDEARVTRIEGLNLIIVGVEEVVDGRRTYRYRQAWWCRVVDAPERVGTGPATLPRLDRPRTPSPSSPRTPSIA